MKSVAVGETARPERKDERPYGKQTEQQTDCPVTQTGIEYPEAGGHARSHQAGMKADQTRDETKEPLSSTLMLYQ